MLPNRSVCTNSSLFDIFQPVLFGQCYGVKIESIRRVTVQCCESENPFHNISESHRGVYGDNRKHSHDTCQPCLSRKPLVKPPGADNQCVLCSVTFPAILWRILKSLTLTVRALWARLTIGMTTLNSRNKICNTITLSVTLSGHSGAKNALAVQINNLLNGPGYWTWAWAGILWQCLSVSVWI